MNLLYIKENSYIRFGYDCYDTDKKIAEKYGIIARQTHDESHEKFFGRIRIFPNQNEYVYNEALYICINSDCYNENEYIRNVAIARIK